MKSKPKAERPVQPKCLTETGKGVCNHPASFHPKDESGERGNCRAFGCDCGQWTPPAEQ